MASIILENSGNSSSASSFNFLQTSCLSICKMPDHVTFVATRGFRAVCKIILNSLCAYDMGNQDGIRVKKV